MPIGLKIEMQDFGGKKISFRNENEDGAEYFQLPVVSLELTMVPQEPPVVTVKFLVSNLDLTLDAVRLAEVAGVSWALYCIHCKEKMVHTYWEDEDGTPQIQGWLCGCGKEDLGT